MAKTTVRLNGCTYVDHLSLDERYKVIRNSLYISLLSLVGNPDGTVIPQKPESNSWLATDMEKRFEKLLQDEPGDFLVVDMTWTVSHTLCFWKDQVFTKSGQFAKSEFYKTHKEEMTEINLLRDPDFDWKPYMDAYLDLVAKYFDKNHIILLRTTCTKRFVVHGHVRPLKKIGKKAYNAFVQELEDYFIEHLDPYVVDLRSQYLLKYNYKKGFSKESPFEKPFYHHARKLISMIIRKQPEQRVFTNQEYFMRLGRFLNYYDNVFARDYVFLFMDDSVFLDHVVLQMSHKLLREFEIDFVTFEERGYQNIDEILEKYNFRFAEPLKQCLQVLKAVEEGDIFREDVKYERIFEYDLKVKKAFTELLKKEWKKSDVISGKIYVNVHNCEAYYKLLLAIREGKNKQIKTILNGLANTSEEKKRMERAVKKSSSMAEAMNEYMRPYEVNVWASEVTRNVLNQSKGRVIRKEEIYQNYCLITPEDKCPEELGAWEDVRSRMKQSASDWLVLDLYELVSNMVFWQGSYVGRESVVKKTKFFKSIKADCQIVNGKDAYSEEEMKSRMDSFAKYVKDTFGKKVILVNVEIKTEFLDENRALNPIRGRKPEELLAMDAFLKKWQKYFADYTKCHVVDVVGKYKADDMNPKGASIIHYQKGFYEECYQNIYDIICKEERA